MIVTSISVGVVKRACAGVPNLLVGTCNRHRSLEEDDVWHFLSL